LVTHLRRGSVSIHHSWPIESYEVYEKIKKIIGQGNISSLFVDLGTEWLRKQEGREPEAPKADEPPKIFTSFKEMDEWLDSLPIEEIIRAESWGRRFVSTAKEKYKAKKFPVSKKQTFFEQIAPSVGLRAIDTSNLESK
jgi:hypothetical protein